MKKIFILVLASLICFGCKKEKTTAEEEISAQRPTLPEKADYALIHGQISNLEVPVDSVLIRNPQHQYQKLIKMQPDGVFYDTLRIPAEGPYQIKIGDEYATVFLKNGNPLYLTSDYPQFDETLKFEGEGNIVDKSNFVIASTLMQEKAIAEEDFALDEAAFSKKLEGMKANFAQLIEKYPNLDQKFVTDSKEQYELGLEGLKKYYQRKKEIANKFTGKPAPSFSGEDINGKKYRLSDFSGKYIYVDVWATWCGPCKAEIPDLKKIEEEYRGKNIEFVSLSIDEASDKETWKNFVREKELKGIQIFDGAAWKSNFIKDLEIQGIPRFILIGPDGKIIDPDAPRPSSEKLRDKLNALEI